MGRREGGRGRDRKKESGQSSKLERRKETKAGEGKKKGNVHETLSASTTLALSFVHAPTGGFDRNSCSWEGCTFFDEPLAALSALSVLRKTKHRNYFTHCSGTESWFPSRKRAAVLT